MIRKKNCMILIIIVILSIIFINVFNKINNPYNFNAYPEEGFLPNEKAAVEIAKCHLRIYTGCDYSSNEFDVVYDNIMQAYKISIKSPNVKDNSLLLEGGTAMILRKKDSKILYFSMYNGLP